MDEDHDGQDYQERDEVAEERTRRPAHQAEKLHQAVLLPGSGPAKDRRASSSEHLCRTSRSIASASSIEEGAFQFLAAPQRQAFSTTPAISRKPIRPARNAATATSFAAFRIVG